MDATEPNSQNETPDLHLHPQSETLINQSKEEDEEEMILKDEENQNSPRKKIHESGTLRSPTNRRVPKRKNRKIFTLNKNSKKFQTLIKNIKPIPFNPTKSLDFVKHQDVLERLGLLEFSKIEFDTNIRTDLIVQLILSFDHKKRCGYVNGFRIKINRADLAKFLKLPPAKQDKGASSGVDEVDLDSEVFDDEAIGFIEDFVFNWMLLHEESWVMPQDILNFTRCIRDGHPEKFDSASLIWYKVEKELAQGDKLVHCYYASHLQHLIWCQQKDFFLEDDDGNAVVADRSEQNVKRDDEREETKENVEVVQEHDIGLTLRSDVEESVHDEVKKDDEMVVDAEENNLEEVVEKEAVLVAEEMEVIAEEEVEVMTAKQVAEEEVEVMTVKQVAEEEVEVMTVKQVPEEEVELMTVKQGNLALNLKNNLDDHFLQRCQSSDLNDYEEEKKVEEVGDEQIEQVDDDDEEEEEEEEDVGERSDEEVGYDMEANDDSLDRAGMTDNFLQQVEASNIPYNSHGISSMDLFESRDGSFLSNGGPSSFFNNGKRLMEPEEEDIHHLGNNKRLKTDQLWDQKPNNFNFCMEQMQQWMEKAKMIHESKEQSFENLQYNQQSEITQLQERHNMLEMIIKSRDEELGKKHTEIFRLERELYLMSDLLSGYRKALNDTRLKFSEYRKRYALKEEPLYKDAGPGGLVLSTREIEKERLKQKENLEKLGIVASNLQEHFVYQFQMHNDKVMLLADKLLSIGNEVNRLKEIAKQFKETRKPVDEVELSVKLEENQKSVDENDLSGEPEENQKSLVENVSSAEPDMNEESVDEQEECAEPEEIQKDEQAEIVENDATMEGVPLDADESKEKEGDEDCIEEKL